MLEGWGCRSGARAFSGALVFALVAMTGAGALAQSGKLTSAPLPPPPAQPAATAPAPAPNVPAAPVVAAVPAAASNDDIARQNAIIVSTLIRSTLIALHQANATGNYTVLRDLAAPTFRENNSAADLANTFASLRDQKVDLSVAAVIEAQLSGAPSLDENRMLRLTGALPTKPNPVSFQLAYLAVDGTWRLSGIAVGPAGPVALALRAAAAKPAEAGAGASSLMPEIRTIVGDPKAKTATAKPKPKTKTAAKEASGPPMALVPPAPKARPKTTN